FHLAAQHSADQIFRLSHNPCSAGTRRFFRCRSVISRTSDWRNIENEVFAFLVQNGEAVQSQRISKQIQWSVRLLDDAQNCRRIGNRERTSLGAAAKLAKELLELTRKIVRRSKFFRHRSRSEAGENKPGIAFASKSHALEDMLSQIDADHRICAFRHDARRAM